MHHLALYSIAGIALLTLLCQWIAWWIKLPAIIFLLLSGILIGPVLHWFNPTQLFGPLLMPLISLSVAIILFEGSLTLNVEKIRGLGGVIRNLLTIGILITATATALLTHFLLNLNWDIAALLGVITAVSGPTVITPMLRTIRPTAPIANTLHFEAILIDPIGALLAILVFGFIATAHGNTQIGTLLYQFTEMVIVGSTLGVVAGYWLGMAIRHHWLPEFLHNITALISVIIVYTLSNRLDDGSGLLAVTIMGIWLANMDDVPVTEILGFKESLSILLISGLFIILAAQINFSHLFEVLWQAIFLLIILQLIVRPLSVAICTWNSELTWRERILIAWIAPRGIVAAAVAALFALRLSEFGISGATQLVLLTFLIIMGTVILQSLTSRLLAHLLKVAEPEAKGLLLIGANPVARSIAKALETQGFRTTITGRNWESISQSRMEGLHAYFGNPISEHADRHLNLIGIGHLLAVSPDSHLNTLAAMRYKSEFGRRNIYAIKTKTSSEKSKHDKYNIASRHQGHILFGRNITFAKLATLISQGANIHSTRLTHNFNFEAYMLKHQNKAIPLFAIDAKKHLHIFTENSTILPEADWIVLSLIKTLHE